MLVKVKADFHPVHGFDLIVEDIDPSFTLGDLLAKLGAIREALRAEDIYDSNKRLPRPEEFVRVAVICPATSAGQGDFRSEADRLQQAGLCDFDYFTATFQGGDASQSIRDAVRAAYDAHKVRPYDALAIIRGGGSVTDLAWLNDLKLARWVCRVPIPVLTGIGHERDSTILDEVAHRRFDTPSKVALHIAHAIRDDAWKAIADLERIRTQVARILTHRENALASGRERLDEQVARILEGAGREVSRWDREIRATAFASRPGGGTRPGVRGGPDDRRGEGCDLRRRTRLAANPGCARPPLAASTRRDGCGGREALPGGRPSRPGDAQGCPRPGRVVGSGSHRHGAAVHAATRLRGRPRRRGRGDRQQGGRDEARGADDPVPGRGAGGLQPRISGGGAMSDGIDLDGGSFNKNYKVLKETADWLSQQDEPDIDQLVPRVERAMKAYQMCKDRLNKVQETLGQYLRDDGAPTERMAASANGDGHPARAKPSPNGDEDGDIPF